MNPEITTEQHADRFLVRVNGRTFGGGGKLPGEGWTYWSMTTQGRRVMVRDRNEGVRIVQTQAKEWTS